MKSNLIVFRLSSIAFGIFLFVLPSCDSSEISDDDFQGDPRILGMWETEFRGSLLFESDGRGQITQTEFKHIRLPDNECWIHMKWMIIHIDEHSFTATQDMETEWVYKYSLNGDNDLRIRLINPPLDFETLYKRSDKTEADMVPLCNL